MARGIINNSNPVGESLPGFFCVCSSRRRFRGQNACYRCWDLGRMVNVSPASS
jgi:hypothetical protein